MGFTMAILKEAFFAVPDGEVYPVWFQAGDTVTGDVEKAAREEGLISEPQKRAPRKKAMKAPENK